ncbi:transporter [Apiospora kogelbergensis]|uniref:transporter n=1 Tax=Apiospora kogelbergensis TaxID=1337665 RepID=UPI00312F4C02
MVLHHPIDDEDGGVIEPLLTRASSSTNATITQPHGRVGGYYTMAAPDQKHFHFDGGEPQDMTPSRRHSIAGYHHHHDLVVAPLRPLILPSQPRRAPRPPVAVVDEDAVIRRIDRCLMPLLFVTQVLASADAAALASAVFLGGLPQDARLQGASDYRALSAWLWLGYLLWVYPTCFFLSTLSMGGPSTTNGRRGRSESNSSSFYTSMYSANSSESLSLFFLSSASSDSSSIISTSSDSSSFASVYSWDADPPNNKKGGGGGGESGSRAGDDEGLEGIRFGVARYLGLGTLAWGAAVAATALTTSYAGLAAARCLLGAAEATVIPALMLVTSIWYARDEVPLRTGIWFAGSAAGGVVVTALGHLLVLLQGLDGNISGGYFGFSFLADMLPSRGLWRWTFLLLGAATFLWGLVILYRLLDHISSSSDSSNSSNAPASNFPGSVAERQWNLDRVAAAETTSKQLWARSSHARPRPVADWKWRQVRECLRDPQTWLVAAMCLLSQIPLSSMRGLADMFILGSSSGSSAPTTMPMSLQVTYMLMTMAAMVGSGWLASRFSSLTCTLVTLAVIPPVIGSACIAKQLHYPPNNGGSGSRLLDDDIWPPSFTHQVLASMLLCTAPAVLPLLLSLIQVNVRGLTKKTTTQALALIAYCLGSLLSPRLFNDEPYIDGFFQAGPPSSSEEERRKEERAASYHTAVHIILLCHGLLVLLAFVLRTYLRRRNRTKQDNEMAEVIDAIETRGGVTEYSLYRGAVDEDAYQHHAGETAVGGGGSGHLLPEDFDDMTDWKIPGFQYHY